MSETARKQYRYLLAYSYPYRPYAATPKVVDWFRGQMDLSADERIVSNTAVLRAAEARIREDAAAFLVPEPSDWPISITSLTLLATPTDQLDDAEWRQERNLSTAAFRAAEAWAALPPEERTMTTVGTVIQPGEQIPYDVTHGETPNGSTWTFADERPSGFCWDPMGIFAMPLTVTAVREQPAEPAPGALAGTVGPHPYERGPYAVDGAQVCGICGERRAAGLHRRPAEDPPGARDADGFLRLKGTATGDNQLDPMPQPAAESEPVDVLDLVRQHGEEQYAEGRAAEQRDDEACNHYDVKARALFARIEAEVQRLRAERDGLHAANEVRKREMASMSAETRMWQSVHDERDEAVRNYEAARDKLRAVVAERDEALAALAEVASATPLTDRLIADVERLRRERNEALAEVERLRQQPLVSVPLRERDELRAYQGMMIERIAELEERLKVAAPGRTEQARDEFGERLWQDGCGSVVNDQSAGRVCPSCNTDAGWRPLLVATAPDPSAETPEAHAYSRGFSDGRDSMARDIRVVTDA